MRLSAFYVSIDLYLQLAKDPIMNENLLIQEMDIKEKIVFLQSFIYLIRTDGKIDQAEKDLIAELIKSYQIAPQYFAGINNVPAKESLLSSLKESVPNRVHGLFLIKELLTIANIDDTLAKEEIQFIESVAETLNIEKEKILQINGLILERKVWLTKNEMVMEYDSAKGE